MGGLLIFICAICYGVYRLIEYIVRYFHNEDCREEGIRRRYAYSELKADWYYRYVDDDLEEKITKKVASYNKELLEQVEEVMDTWKCWWCSKNRVEETYRYLVSKGNKEPKLKKRMYSKRIEYLNTGYNTDAVRILLAKQGKIRREDAEGVYRDRAIDVDRNRTLYDVMNWMNDELQKHGMKYPIIICNGRQNFQSLRFADPTENTGRYTWFPVEVFKTWTYSPYEVDLDTGRPRKIKQEED